MTRQKNSLAEELVNARRECERTNETCVRIAKEKENLTKEKAQLVVDLTAAERENRAQSEVCYVNLFMGLEAIVTQRKNKYMSYKMGLGLLGCQLTINS